MHDYLVSIGFSDKEATVYLALLSVVHMSHLEISRATGIKRSTVYTIIDSLTEKKMVREVPFGRKVHYGAVDPQRLASFVTEKRAKLEEQYHTLDDVIPRMRSMAHAGNIGMTVKRYDAEDEIVDQYAEVCSGSTERKRRISIQKELFESLLPEHRHVLKKQFPDIVLREDGSSVGVAVHGPHILLHTQSGQHDAVVITSPQLAEYLFELLS